MEINKKDKIIETMINDTQSNLNNENNKVSEMHLVLNVKRQSKELNIAKYALSIISMVFDIIFMVQHYILYRNSNSDLDGKKVNDETVEKLINSARESTVNNYNQENNNNN